MKVLIRFEFFGGRAAEVTEGGNDIMFHIVFCMKNN